MITPTAGWYVRLSPRASLPADDLFGPFESKADLLNWLEEHGVSLREGEAPSASGPSRPVRYFIEMVDDDLDGEYSPWATGIEYVG